MLRPSDARIGVGADDQGLSGGVGLGQACRPLCLGGNGPARPIPGVGGKKASSRPELGTDSSPGHRLEGLASG